MTIHAAILLASVILCAACMNLPLGYLREKSERFSLDWFFYVHVSIPAVMFLRIRSGFSWKVIPLTLAAVIAGQMLGGRLYKQDPETD